MPFTPQTYRRMSGHLSAIRYIAALTLLLSLIANTALSAPIYPRLTGQIVDRANMLSTAQKQALLEQLSKLEKKSSDQLVIVTLPSLQGYDIAEFSVELARHWKIGQKGTDNGILLVIAPKERKMRIEVGYGLEGTLTDSLADAIIRRSIKPHFKKGKMFDGILSGTKDIIDILLGNKDEVAQRLKAKKTSPKGNFGNFLPFILFFVFALAPTLFSFLGGTGNSKGGGVLIIPQDSDTDYSSTGSSGGWSSGGGWSDGSGGGWSGGGGGFGGGGSSGSW